jgi:glycosyltransferase involved in cell wall biosynthesis
MRIAIVYDCLFPHTVGGAERWYRSLAERLSESREVTYLTRRQWGPEGPGTPFRTTAVAPGGPLYTRSGRRRIWPPLRFGIGVFWHLLRHGERYDVVHSASFPYFSLLGAWLAGRLRRRGRLVVDWAEVWTRQYWHEYLGPIGGSLGWWVQRLCVRIPQQAFCFSRLHERRLRDEGFRDPVVVLGGAYAGALVRPSPLPATPVMVFAGRHIPEKRVTALVPAIAEARRELSELRCDIYGDGPMRAELERLIAAHGLEDVVHVHGRSETAVVEQAFERALCMVLPSRREGYGLVVVEAAARGTPSIVVRGEDNAATELVEDGENGVVAASAAPAELARAILRVHALGPRLRESTADWFARNAHRLSLDASLETVVASYERSANGGESASTAA